MQWIINFSIQPLHVNWGVSVLKSQNLTVVSPDPLAKNLYNIDKAVSTCYIHVQYYVIHKKCYVIQF